MFCIHNIFMGMLAKTLEICKNRKSVLRKFVDKMNFAFYSKNLAILTGQLKLERFEDVNEQITSLMKLMKRFNELKLSAIEFGYLKIISFTANGKFQAVLLMPRQSSGEALQFSEFAQIVGVKPIKFHNFEI